MRFISLPEELFISACVDRFLLLSKREIYLPYDRRGLPLPSCAHGCRYHEGARLAEVVFLSAGVLLCTFTLLNYSFLAGNVMPFK